MIPEWKRAVINDRLKRAQKMANSYESCINYWSNPIRIVAQSSTFNQSREFMAERISTCHARLYETLVQIDIYRDQLG